MTRQRLLLALTVLYFVLLATSHLARRSKPDAPPAIPLDKKQAFLAEDVLLAYREFGTQQATSEVPVLLLHGSPGSSADFLTLGPALASDYRVLAPDLPGFGHSTRVVSDYSLRAHAGYALDLLRHLDLEKVHVVGFSMGGGVALEIARQDPDRLRSLTLLSSIGVQELELIGDYRLNHAVHGLQLAAVWALHEGVPHFGLLDGFLLDVPYARNFYDSDQRPLRPVLETLEVPTLIVHGEHDVLVPVSAAREHHRLVPQSEMVLVDANHFMVFGKGAVLAEPISEFLDRVEEDLVPARNGARTDRLEAAARPFDPRDLPQAHGMALVALMFLLAIATFASEDLASIGTGLLVAQGRIGFFAGAVACFVGILVGDVAIYFAGRFLGRPWLSRAPIRWLLSPNAVERSRQWFQRRGPSVVFASRFLPGTRVATYFASGLLGTGLWRFLAYLSIAVALWVPLIVGVTSILGARIFDLFDTFSRFALPGILALAVVGWLLLRMVKTIATSSGRRRLVGRWRSIRHWEFWPPWLFYPPVLLHILRLAMRHRSLTVFTAANPSIPAGGFIGESKAGILAGLDQKYVARYQLVPGGLSPAEKRLSIERFMSENTLDFPLVLKPDVGQRGSGVVVVRDADQVARHLESSTHDLLAQEFVPGPELGVFYIRLPGDERGRIFSVTEKRLPTLKGDGHTTVENLVLADERAVAMAPVFLDRLAEELDRIPDLGEIVRLVEVGTHCLGAVFLDGKRFRSPELEAKVDEISRTYSGFYFGRYDLKAPSYEAFERGDDIKVIELNGVTSEATHIYDPANSLVDAYRTLFEQWDLAFEVGKRNAADGAPVTSAGDLVRIIAREWAS